MPRPRQPQTRNGAFTARDQQRYWDDRTINGGEPISTTYVVTGKVRTTNIGDEHLHRLPDWGRVGTDHSQRP
jgi:hypothetical protein